MQENTGFIIAHIGDFVNRHFKFFLASCNPAGNALCCNNNMRWARGREHMA